MWLCSALKYSGKRIGEYVIEGLLEKVDMDYAFLRGQIWGSKLL